MTVENICATSELIQKHAIKHRRELLRQPAINLESRLKNLEFSSDEITNTSTAFENLLGTFSALNDNFYNLKRSGFNYPEQFFNIYFLNKSAEFVSNDSNFDSNYSTLESNINFNNYGHLTLSQNVVDDFIKQVEEKGSNLSLDTGSFITDISHKTKSFLNSKYMSEQHELNKLKIIINGAEQEKSKILTLNSEQIVDPYSHIVANTEAIRFAKSITGDVKHYNPFTKTNLLIPNKEPLLICFYGDPGCGKSEIIKAMSKDLENYIISDPNLIYQELKLDPSDANKKFRGESEENVAAVFAKMRNPKALSYFYVDDFDLVIDSRDEMEHNNLGKGNLHLFMNYFSGSNKDYLGNTITAIATNEFEKLDRAVINRVGDNFIEVKGPETAEDFSKLIAIKLGSKIKYVHYDRNLLDLGTYFANGKSKVTGRRLTGRDANSFVNNIIPKFRNGSIPPESKYLTLHEYQKIIDDGHNELSVTDMIKFFKKSYK